MKSEDEKHHQEQTQGLPSISSESLRSLLLHPHHPPPSPASCPVCHGTFFPLLRRELTSVSHYFNNRVRWLSQVRRASGVMKCLLWVRHQQARSHLSMIQEGQSLVNYVSMTILASRELLKEYDLVHLSSEGSKFKTWLSGVHLQSPWLVELVALYFNLKSDDTTPLPEMCPGCVFDLKSGKPTLSCKPHESLKLELDLTCSICLETVFDPVALKCGHIFCLSCACAAASVIVLEGLKKAKKNARCPLCREVGVFASGFRLTELNLFISRSCKDYWGRRRQRERNGRLKQAKEFWSVRLEDVGTPAYLM